MIKDKIIKNLKQSLEKIGIKEERLELDHPTNPDFGDYATSIALKLAKRLKKNPVKIAEQIVKNLSESILIEKIEIVKPGFINFWLTKKILTEELIEIVKKEKTYGKKQPNNFKIVLEFGQPNTHKLPHIGHLFSYIFGESLAKVLESQGNRIFHANYQGDIGLHVAKCLYQFQRLISIKAEQIGILNSKNIKEKVEFLQKCYQEGSKLYEKDVKAKKEIDKLNKKIYRNDPSILKLWKETKKWSLDFYKQFEEKLGVKYDKYYFESETGPVGKQIVKKNLGKFFKQSNGAIIFEGEKYGLHTRVFINKYDNPTYEAKDIGLVSFKIRDFLFNLSIVTTANEQNEYWKVVLKASELIFPHLVGKLKHLGFGMINLATGKMSSRTGHIINAFSLVDEVKKQIKTDYHINDNLAEKIALTAIKYSFLKTEATKNIVFDLKRSIAKEGDSGPYLLYVYVRTQSVLKKEPSTNINLINPPAASLPAWQGWAGQLIKYNSEELSLMRKLYQFPEIIEKAAQSYTPHLIGHFLFEIARDFNLFYQKCPILKAKPEVRNFRLLLTKAVGQVIKNGLYLLGIETVEKM